MKVDFDSEDYDDVFVPRRMLRKVFGEVDRDEMDKIVRRANVSSRNALSKLYCLRDVIDELEAEGYDISF